MHSVRFALLILLFASTFSAVAQTLDDPFIGTLPASISLVSSGGGWTDSDQQGIYRVVAVTEGWEHLQSRLYIQWLAEDDAQQKLTLVATTQVAEVSDLTVTGAYFEPASDGVLLRITTLNSHSMEQGELEVNLGGKRVYRIVKQQR